MGQPTCSAALGILALDPVSSTQTITQLAFSTKELSAKASAGLALDPQFQGVGQLFLRSRGLATDGCVSQVRFAPLVKTENLSELQGITYGTKARGPIDFCFALLQFAPPGLPVAVRGGGGEGREAAENRPDAGGEEAKAIVIQWW
jgi:hypothetical protein